MTARAARLAADPRAAGLILLALAVAPLTLWAMTAGSAALSPAAVIGALAAPDGSREAVIVTHVRLPRVLAALVAGSGLATAGAVMQAVTANPLASPSLLGVNAGAAFAVVLAMVLAPGGGGTGHVLAAFAGAGMATVAVYALGSAGRGGATPLRLALAGAVISAFLAALTAAVLIFDQRTLAAVRLWTVGSLEGRQMAAVLSVLPWWAAGLAGTLACRGQVMTLSLGAAVAQGVGQNLPLWRGLSALAVVLMAGAAVALTGPVGFVGLVVPHVARLVAGADYRWILPYSAVMGALLVLLADGGLRHLLPGRDIPVGVAMALIGAPFFIWLARTRIGAVR